jgi:hypothetical protein
MASPFLRFKIEKKTEEEIVLEKCDIRCQVQIGCTNETSFRPGAERNVTQQKMDTTLCQNRSNTVLDGSISIIESSDSVLISQI